MSPVLPWKLSACSIGLSIGCSAPRATGTSAPPQELEELPRVPSPLLHVNVAVDRRDRLDLYLWAGEGEEESQGVVDARVCVEDYPLQRVPNL